MTYATIKRPPQDEASYTKAAPYAVIAALREGKNRVVTSGMIGAVSDTIEFANSNGYSVSMIRGDDPADFGGIMSLTGVFYIRRDGDKI
jgi:predicted Zn-dependent protease